MDFERRDVLQDDHKHDRLDALGFGCEGRRVTVACAECHKPFEWWQTRDDVEPQCNECLFKL